MSVLDWFKSEASWREKATTLAAKLAATVAAHERLEQDAATRALAAGLDDKEIVRIERDIQELAARERWLHRALAEAKARAAADDMAAEAERQRLAAEAKARRIAEASAGYLASADALLPAARALVAELEQAVRYGGELAGAHDTPDARRLLGPEEIAARYRITLWREVRNWFPYPFPGAMVDARKVLPDLEREVLAEIAGAGQPDAAATEDEPGAPPIGDYPRVA